MAQTIPQVVGESSSTPVNGQPWNFHGVLDCYLLPRVIACDPKLLPGARLLWAVIRNYSTRDGHCTLSDNALGRAVAVHERQVRNYCRQLERAGLLRTVQRAGKTPERMLLWDSRFAGKIRPTPALECRGGGTTVPGGRHYSAGAYKEETSSKTSSKKKITTIEKPVAGNASSSPERPAPAEWTEEEYIRRGRECGFPDHVIRRDLERLRARKAESKTNGLVKSAELKPELEAAIRR